MTWDALDWRALDRLRERFLQGPGTAGPYWQDAGDLASYDLTYGERIGWKWDHVLRELRLRRWRPPSPPGTGIPVLDWGCGSGVAARRVISFFGAELFESLTVWDHSPLACDYAADTARAAFPHLRVSQATPGFFAGTPRIGLLVVSHVLNELAPDALAELGTLARRAAAVLWVEPGTHAISRQLGALRDGFRDAFRIVAPCTHELGCPVFGPGNERDWCHFFAPPPSEIFADSNWVKFGQRAGIDLRSLPYAFIALQKAAAPADPVAMPDAAVSRVIGRVEHFKPYARLLNCDATGLTQLELPKRADPALFKQLERTKAPLVYRWRRDGAKITGGEPLG
jgi:SAM-dependent methyltransferase